MIKEIKGIHVLITFVLAFGVIIAVHITLAVNAVRTFPGLEVKNSYVASQNFEADRQAQLDLGWEVKAWVDGDVLSLEILEDGTGIHPIVDTAIFGRATSVEDDQALEFSFENGVLRAPVTAGPGNWNLRLQARSEDGVQFSQRIIVDIRS